MAGIKLPKKKPVPPTPVTPKVGKLHPATTLFFHSSAGTAKKGRTKYNLSVSMPGGLPVITNKKNGRSWSVGWDALMVLAAEDGIDAPLSEQEKKAWGWACPK